MSSTNAVQTQAVTPQVKVWDPLVRIFHWSLVASFFIAYFVTEENLPVHVWAGYVVLGLVLFRLVWGLVGTRHARFADFVRRPSTVVAFLRDSVARRSPRHLGHNPAGGWMIVAMLVSLILLTVTGLALYGVGEHAGPLASLMAGFGEHWKESLEEVHEFFANFTVLLVVVHVAGVVVESVLHRENLARAMVTGYKRAQ